MIYSNTMIRLSFFIAILFSTVLVKAQVTIDSPAALSELSASTVLSGQCQSSRIALLLTIPGYSDIKINCRKRKGIEDWQFSLSNVFSSLPSGDLTFRITQGTNSASRIFRKTQIVNAPESCNFNGQMIASGSSVTAYRESSVAYDASCISEQRLCIDGSLSGSFQYASCQTQDAPPVVVDPQPPTSTGSKITSLQVRSLASVAQAAPIISFAHVFAQNEVSAQQNIAATLNGQAVALQVDKKATHADGSLRHAIFHAELPNQAAGANSELTLFAANESLQGASLTLENLLQKNHDIEVVVVQDSVLYSTTLRKALAESQVKTWVQGPLATEFNAHSKLNNYLHVYFDVRLHKNGLIKTDVIVTNDWSDRLGVKTFTYDVTIKQNGQVVFANPTQKHNRFSNWRKTFFAGNTAPLFHVIREPIQWRKSKAILNYPLDIPVLETNIASMYTSFLNSDRSPMGGSLIYRYMPGTGGRADIGPETRWATSYILSQDPRAQEIMLGVADAGGSIPWHYRNPVNLKPVTRAEKPKIWLDGRCGTGPDCPLEPWTTADTEWTTDVAHHPSLYYIPYMITGERYYLDQLQMQAAAIINSHNHFYFNINGVFYMNSQSNQVRAAAWGLRTVANAAYLTPDQDALKSYLNMQVQNELDLSVQRLINTDSIKQGQLTGYIGGYNLGSSGEIAPWQDDFFTIVYGYVYQRGWSQAKTLLDWKVNFTAGRFLKPDTEFCSNNGPGYYYKVTDANNLRLSTWSGVYLSTYGTMVCPTTMSGYPHWAGGYAAGALAANATLAQYGYNSASAALSLIKSRTTLWLNTNTRDGYASDPTFAISAQPIDSLIKP